MTSPRPGREAVRPATITMLGTQLSGKTTYLVTMYGTLSLGAGRAAVFAGPNQDHELGEFWERLLREGQLPPPTAEEPQGYRFAFTYDGRKVAELDWTDFRGGAMDARVPDDDNLSDTAQLVARLAQSDSLYLVLDGAELAAGRPDAAVASALLTRRMTALVRGALAGRRAAGRPPPSLVALVTKADRLVDGICADAGVWQAMDATIERVRRLLPVLSEPGTLSLICPVSIGHLGDHQGGRVDPARIDPLWPEKPVLFSVVAHLDAERARHEADQAGWAREEWQLASDLARAGRLERRRRRELEAAQAAAQQEQRLCYEAAQACAYWAGLLRPSLDGTPVYLGGARAYPAARSPGPDGGRG